MQRPEVSSLSTKYSALRSPHSDKTVYQELEPFSQLGPHRTRIKVSFPVLEPDCDNDEPTSPCADGSLHFPIRACRISCLERVNQAPRRPDFKVRENTECARRPWRCIRRLVGPWWACCSPFSWGVLIAICFSFAFYAVLAWVLISLPAWWGERA